ncbi:MAG: hypothetical protein ACLU9S_23625 [Oscillospiraceae bacterium]
MAWIAMALGSSSPTSSFKTNPPRFWTSLISWLCCRWSDSFRPKRASASSWCVHDLNQAALNSDRLAILQAGRLKAVGTPEELCRPEMFRDIFRVETERVSFDRGKNYYIPLKMTPEER